MDLEHCKVSGSLVFFYSPFSLRVEVDRDGRSSSSLQAGRGKVGSHGKVTNTNNNHFLDTRLSKSFLVEIQIGFVENYLCIQRKEDCHKNSSESKFDIQSLKGQVIRGL